MKKIVFLYTELAGYFLSCVEALLSNPDTEVHIFRYPVNKEAPFEFNSLEKVSFYNRQDFNSEQLVQKLSEINPTAIYCSGWKDRTYLFACRKFRPKIPVIVGFDNQWNASLKQRLACILSFYKIHPYFNYCWVPGKPQYAFALRLGFKPGQILTGFYSADFKYFNNLFKSQFHDKEKKLPHRFLYVGRYYEFKGISELWNAFIKASNDTGSDWELWCLGTGDLKPVEHPKIKHFGFVQPSLLEKYAAQCSVFILPSRFEPWGVVVHEFAAAGFALICSGEVGAASTFMEHGLNGYVFKSGNEEELCNSIKKIIGKSDSEIISMCRESEKKSHLITPEIWSETLLKAIEKF